MSIFNKIFLYRDAIKENEVLSSFLRMEFFVLSVTFIFLCINYPYVNTVFYYGIFIVLYIVTIPNLFKFSESISRKRKHTYMEHCTFTIQHTSMTYNYVFKAIADTDNPDFLKNYCLNTLLINSNSKVQIPSGIFECNGNYDYRKNFLKTFKNLCKEHQLRTNKDKEKYLCSNDLCEYFLYKKFLRNYILQFAVRVIILIIFSIICGATHGVVVEINNPPNIISVVSALVGVLSVLFVQWVLLYNYCRCWFNTFSICTVEGESKLNQKMYNTLGEVM